MNDQPTSPDTELPVEAAPVYTCPGCGAALTSSALQCGACGWIVGTPASDTTDWTAYTVPYSLANSGEHDYGRAWNDSGYTPSKDQRRIGGYSIKQGEESYTAEPPSTTVDDLDTWFNTGVTAQAAGITDTVAYLKELAADGHTPSPAERESFYAGVVTAVEADRTAAIPPSAKRCYRCDSVIDVNYTGLCWSCRQATAPEQIKLAQFIGDIAGPALVVNTAPHQDETPAPRLVTTYDGSFMRGEQLPLPGYTDLPEGELLDLAKRNAASVFGDNLHLISESDQIENGLGLLMSAMFGWDGSAILRVARHALEDANFHSEAAAIEKMISKYSA